MIDRKAVGAARHAAFRPGDVLILREIPAVLERAVALDVEVEQPSLDCFVPVPVRSYNRGGSVLSQPEGGVMVRTVPRLMLALVSPIALLVLAVGVSGQVFVGTPPPPQFAAQGQPSTKNGEWPHYTADLKGTRYSPLDQITGANFSKLEVAWRFKTDNFGPFPEFKLEGTPLMVKGVLYTTAGTRRSVIALDAKTGELIWSHSLREGKRAARRPAAVVGPWGFVLDRRQRGRARHLCHDGLSARRAQCEDGRPGQFVRHQRDPRPESRRGQGEQAADRSGDR